ncbi:hypothetical protein LINPERHAP1_LOCUS23922 [Linum perenne]
MMPEIGANFLGYATAKELWDDVSSTYSDLGNQSQVYDLTLKLATITQGDDSVTRYYNVLKQVWQDLDQFNDYIWKSSEDHSHYKKSVDTNQIFKFLVGLNVELDEVRGRIIGRDPLPPIAEVFNEVRREETRRKVMLGARKGIQTTEGSAFQATSGILGATPNTLAAQRHHGHDPKAHLRCDFCGKTRHTKDMCWKLHPHLKNGGRTGEAEKPRANATTSHGGVSMLTSEQIEQLLSLLNSQSESAEDQRFRR